ncbi:ABC transporter ATP-binding protein [Photobacterium sp. OFAV2-7]|uniref:ABC transporter ATP-binding protein n=1 Tax=Photobacterium sp. OFAV2-7 TaxID=2917748 RepID=UPI001EF46B15|nr:ABC transporter ATP-binding protein [Photobacterium sp. OFAV2-7]MCG7586640.1 ABC transporter ATP-binding protein [Photobacterium sp. OFAV2-7]
MSFDTVIQTRGLRKKFLMFSNPLERLKQLIGINKNYEEHVALDDINIEIRKGETVGIIGVNGSGKSTLLQLICGTLNPSEGEVTVNGRVAALLELGAGFNPEFTGIENVYLNSTLMGLSRQETDLIFDDIVEFADIGDFIHQPVKTYSSGMFARLAFSTAIHVKPEILIVDEILAVGDSRFQRKCLDKFREIRESGCTILFVSHDDYQVRNICDKVLYLKSGEQVFFGSANEGVTYYLQDLQEQDGKNNKVETADSISANKIVEVSNPLLLNSTNEEVNKIESGESITLQFDFECLDNELVNELCFVFNLYRKDNVYVCGTTTEMQEVKILKNYTSGRVKVTFPNLKLLAGIYNWRIAINDSDGIQILTEMLPVCEFSVSDNFKAVGIYDIEHEWLVEEL